jgi:hypothetical protein
MMHIIEWKMQLTIRHARVYFSLMISLELFLRNEIGNTEQPSTL